MAKQRIDVLAQSCPSRQVLSRIADKWTTLVI
jgi:DNA-binding HxlR family transcriptional regulator